MTKILSATLCGLLLTGCAKKQEEIVYDRVAIGSYTLEKGPFTDFTIYNEDDDQFLEGIIAYKQSGKYTIFTNNPELYDDSNTEPLTPEIVAQFRDNCYKEDKKRIPPFDYPPPKEIEEKPDIIQRMNDVTR